MPNNSTQTKKQTWKQNPEAVKADILKVATKEMAKHGLTGSRINIIAELSNTSKRMIYYYFKDKEGLYKAVLESTYKSIRDAEKKLKIINLNPKESLERLIEFTINHHKKNPDFIRLIMIENIHDCKYLKESNILKEVNAPAIKRIKDIYDEGVKLKIFKEGIDPLEIHWFISSMSFFNVSNESSFSTAFGKKISEKKTQDELTSHIIEMITKFVLN